MRWMASTVSAKCNIGQKLQSLCFDIGGSMQALVPVAGDGVGLNIVKRSRTVYLIANRTVRLLNHARLGYYGVLELMCACVHSFLRFFPYDDYSCSNRPRQTG